MKRFFLFLIIIILAFLLQTTIFQYLALAGVVPNLLLIITVATGYMRGRIEGMTVGLVCGFLADTIYGDVIGLYMLFYLCIGYLNGLCNKIYYKDDFTIPIILVGVSDLIYNFFCYVTGFLLRNRLDFFYYLRTIMLPDLIYTVLVSIIFYKLLHSLNKLLEKFEIKGA